MSPSAQPDNAALNNLLKELHPEHAEPLWTVLSKVSPAVPQPKAIPNLWKYKKLRPLLDEAGRIVPQEESERRAFMLINPALKRPQTTDTLYAALQYINSGEVAPAHRHTPFALRFIIEGTGGWTAVEGEKIYMEKGDVILTPRWQWHDHGKDGEGAMVWLDGLDLPMLNNIPVCFTEHYDQDRYPSIEVKSSTIKYPWSEVQKYFDSVNGDHAVYNYQFQTEERESLSSIIAAQAEKIVGGKSSPDRLESSSFIYHVYEGKGRTIITDDNGVETVIKWESKDTFCIPAWRKFIHINEGQETVYLFNFNDSALLKNLNIYRADKNSAI